MRLRPSELASKFSVSFGLLTVMLGVLWIAGGASRADVLGRAITGGVAWLVLVICIAAGERPALYRVAAPAMLLAAAIILPLLQLVPLPVSVWEALPGRTPFIDAAIASGEAQPWRPLSIVPAATFNALTSLVVPGAVLILLSCLRSRERAYLPGIMLGLITASTLVGLLQASGASFGNAFINITPGDVSGTFANRNHFALFVSIGCVLVPIWPFLEGRKSSWRGPVALALGLLFVLTILATGSRAGIAVGALAISLGLLFGREGLQRQLRRAPKWVLPAVTVAVIALLAGLILISISADRAVSINRLMAIDTSGDTRVRAMPTVISMISGYFPAGTGFGSFDPVFRLNEPYQMLKPTYFNHAHNDFLEIVLDGGLPGAALILAGLLWWLHASVRAWRAPSGPAAMMPRTGSAILLLIMAASIVDYPARTPMTMAVIVLAATWLAEAGTGRRPTGGAEALPA